MKTIGEFITWCKNQDNKHWHDATSNMPLDEYIIYDNWRFAIAANSSLSYTLSSPAHLVKVYNQLVKDFGAEINADIERAFQDA